jgi:hypothetical protein
LFGEEAEHKYNKKCNLLDELSLGTCILSRLVNQRVAKFWEWTPRGMFDG